MKWHELIRNLQCPVKGCNGILNIPKLYPGQCFSGHVHPNRKELDVRCRKCNVRFIITNPNSVYLEL